VFAKRGIVPEAASSWFLPRLIGITKALELCYSGKIISAESANDINLVSEVLPQEQLLVRALEIADESILCASIGSSAPSMRHIICLVRAMEICELSEVNSLAISKALAINCS
jgi:enoyl-CoA hydratase/carnithine racemase